MKMILNNDACIEYERKFNEKIDSFKNRSEYDEWLRRYADDALRFHTSFGYLAIKAKDFINRIISKPESYIEDWLDGKNQLEW